MMARSPVILLVALLLTAFGHARADASPFDNTTFGFCLLWWSDVGDNGYTDAHQDGFVAAVSALHAKYPLISFTSKRVVNVAFASDKLGAYTTLVTSHACNFIFFSYSDLYISDEWLQSEALANPDKLYVVGDLGAYQASWPRNVVSAEPICDREWFLAGAVAGRMFSNLSLVMTISFEDQGTSYATHALAAGIRDAQQGQANISRPRVVPTNGWLQTKAERIVAELAINQTGADVITHFSDPYVASAVAHDQNKHSIGWGHDYSNFYLESLLTSVIRVYDKLIFDIAEEWIFNMSTQQQTFACLLTDLSTDVPPAVVSYFESLNGTLNMTADVWSDEFYYNQSGYPVLAGPLSPLDVGLMNFTTNFSILNSVFKGPASCDDNFVASYQTTPEFLVVCTACPAGTYSRGGDACAVCVTGEVLCPSVVAQPSRSDITTIIGASIGVGAPILLIITSLTCYFQRRARRLKLQIKAVKNEPGYSSGSGSTTLSNATTATSRFDINAALTRAEILRGEYCLGVGVPSPTLGATVYKCFQNDGGTLSVYEFPRRTSADAAHLDQLLCKVSAHPNIVNVYCVRWNEERVSLEIFCEMTSGGTLQDMLNETKGRLVEQSARMFSMQILNAVVHLHKHRCAHRSISASSVFLTSSGTPKLFCSPLINEKFNDDDSLTVVTDVTFASPPEVLTGSFEGTDAFESACRVDVWMFGVLVAQVLNSGSSPWPVNASHPHAINAYILKQQGRPILAPSCSEAAQHFVHVATEPSPSARPKAGGLLAHPWMSQRQPGMSSNGSVGHTRGESSVPSTVVAQPKPKVRGYQVGKLIGVGSFGTVHIVTLPKGEEVAMKSVTIDIADPSAPTRLRRAQREYDILSAIHHPNIIRYLSIEFDGIPDVSSGGGGSSMSSSLGGKSGGSLRSKGSNSSAIRSSDPNLCHMRIFMEYIPGGTLKQFLSSIKGGKLSTEVATGIVVSMLRALETAHEHGIIHRDVKSSNFLYCGAPDFVKLADFGSAAMVHGGSTTSVSMQGTLLYMAPETLREELPTFAADVWSLGATVLELLTGQPPWSHIFGHGAPIMAIVAYVASNEAIQIPAGLGELPTDFVKKCLVRQPACRATVKELLLHPWLTAAVSFKNV